MEQQMTLPVPGVDEQATIDAAKDELQYASKICWRMLQRVPQVTPVYTKREGSMSNKVSSQTESIAVYNADLDLYFERLMDDVYCLPLSEQAIIIHLHLRHRSVLEVFHMTGYCKSQFYKKKLEDLALIHFAEMRGHLVFRDEKKAS